MLFDLREGFTKKVDVFLDFVQITSNPPTPTPPPTPPPPPLPPIWTTCTTVFECQKRQFK